MKMFYSSTRNTKVDFVHKTELTLQVISFAETRTVLASIRVRLHGICALKRDR